ncbi:EcoAI/FtnUII family type I restriction enzme subunit R [Flavobacterium sp.]|uniref:EcoAI/FtnUII family type I restriction enzme subunit R n=1 Tax=Flavobacterium sp. TaxID=239 RepID=UPI00286DB3E2|nr:DEAD/DEAH box helicase family protein [Flavobacterium sp.]
MNEAETRAELIDPQLKASGWGIVEDSKVFREYHITAGRIQIGGKRAKPIIADYILVYKGIKLAIVEAKSDELEVGEGVMQAKEYAFRLQLKNTYATNGIEIYHIQMETATERLVSFFPTPEELWQMTFAKTNAWRDKFNAIPFELIGGTKGVRYYQENAVGKTMEAIANNQDRILLTLATGTGKTFIAFQIAWKLFQSRWNLKKDGSRRPRILFLADRNILANQAFNSFAAFQEDALVRIKPSEIKKKGKVPTNGSIFFTIFQTFMSGTDTDGNPEPYFGEYPKDFFDFIIIDECHRGGANDEGNWRRILEYFSPAFQLGLTATPKRKDNIDTYKYFGEPVYIYSLKEGINDGFLTPFKVKRIQTTLDEYVYTDDDDVVTGEIDQKKVYKEGDFNRIIEIKEREKKRIQLYLDDANPNEKAIVFCANQAHAAAVRDLINQLSNSKNPNYCVRVTANDGAKGEQYLEDFQDNEKTIPTILTTSQKLSTGVDARNVRNVVLLRPVNSMIEFKQIIGRGTRMFDGKDYFTIYDYVDAYKNFLDPEWDGEPIEPEPNQPIIGGNGPKPGIVNEPPQEPIAKLKREKIKIKLADGKERSIKSMMSTSFWNADGKPISAEQFIQNLFGKLPEFFSNEEELRTIWSNPITRKSFLDKLDIAGYSKDILLSLQELIEAEKSDLFDVLEYIAYNITPILRTERVELAKKGFYLDLDTKHQEFLNFVLSKYIETGVDELDQEKLPQLLMLKYQSISDSTANLGGIDSIRNTFIGFQKYLYSKSA